MQLKISLVAASLLVMPLLVGAAGPAFAQTLAPPVPQTAEERRAQSQEYLDNQTAVQRQQMNQLQGELAQDQIRRQELFQPQPLGRPLRPLPPPPPVITPKPPVPN